MGKLRLEDIPIPENSKSRGIINNVDIIRQGHDFNEFENDKIHPSDIDIIWTFDSKFLILSEIKHISSKGKDIPKGQDILIKDLIRSWVDCNKISEQNKDALHWQRLYYELKGIPINEKEFSDKRIPNTNKQAIAYKLLHDTPEDQNFITVKDCKVESYLLYDKWIPYDGDEPFIEVFHQLGRDWKIKKITSSFSK